MTEQIYTKINLLLDSDVSFTQQEIKEELGLHILPNQLPTFKMFMVNFAEHREPLAFSVGNNQYPPRDFNVHEVTYSTVQGVVKKLDKSKLANFFKGKPRSRVAKAELSRLKPSKKLMDWVDEKFPYADSIYLNPQTHVRLRAMKSDAVVSFKPTLYSRHIDLVMKNYHQKLIDWGYSLDRVAMDKLHMYMNFRNYDSDNKGNPNIRYGGRWWGNHNQLPSKNRVNRISFDNVEGGDELVELDFTASILTALRYWTIGREPEKDHYKLFRHDDYVDREHIKNLTKLMLNRKRNGLEDSYGRKFYPKGQTQKDLTFAQKVELHWIQDTAGRFIAKNHYMISHWFFRGRRAGQLASFIESNLVLEIVRRCCNENIPVLTVYDSFIVPKKHKKRVYELMYEEDVLPFVKDVIEKDDQDTVERTLAGYIDFNKPTVKKWMRLAKEKRMILLDTTMEEKRYLFQFIDCGHTVEYMPNNLTKRDPVCEICFGNSQFDKLDAEAREQGFKLVGHTINSRVKVYSCLKCGKESDKQVHTIRNGSVECKHCSWEELLAYGRSHGTKVIGKSDRVRRNDDGVAKSYWYVCECMKCGHRQDILPRSIKDGYFSCHGCNESAYELPSNVYLLRLTYEDLTWLKLGHAQTVESRIKQYGLAEGVDVEILKTVEMDTGHNALTYEHKLHKKFRKYKANEETIRKYMLQSGYSETYTLEALDKLLEELESV